MDAQAKTNDKRFLSFQTPMSYDPVTASLASRKTSRPETDSPMQESEEVMQFSLAELWGTDPKAPPITDADFGCCRFCGGSIPAATKPYDPLTLLKCYWTICQQTQKPTWFGLMQVAANPTQVFDRPSPVINPFVAPKESVVYDNAAAPGSETHDMDDVDNGLNAIERQFALYVPERPVCNHRGLGINCYFHDEVCWFLFKQAKLGSDNTIITDILKTFQHLSLNNIDARRVAIFNQMYARLHPDGSNPMNTINVSLPAPVFDAYEVLEGDELDTRLTQAYLKNVSLRRQPLPQTQTSSVSVSVSSSSSSSSWFPTLTYASTDIHMG